MILKSLLAAALLASSAFGITISTGNTVGPNVPWMVNSNPVALLGVLATPIWIGNFGDGRWVGTTVNDGNPAIGIAPGTYVFSLNLSTWVGGSGSGTFDLQYAADNSVIWTISNGSLGGTTQCDAGATPLSDCFQATAGAPRMLNGTFGVGSVLTATVVNGSATANPMGLLVVGTASDVPEPSTYAMLTLGGAAIAFARLRRK